MTWEIADRRFHDCGPGAGCDDRDYVGAKEPSHCLMGNGEEPVKALMRGGGTVIFKESA